MPARLPQAPIRCEVRYSEASRTCRHSAGLAFSDTARASFRPPTRMIGRFFSKDWHWAVLLVLLNLLFFGDALFTDQTFYFRDVSFFHYPLKKLVTEAYASGEWPLWNPYIQLGQPLLANPNTMALYPTQILFQILPFQFAFEMHFVLHCILGGIATFYLARNLELCPSSAFIGAAIYNFSGVTLSFVNLFNILPVVMFLPLLTLTLIKLLQGVTVIRLLSACVVFGAFGLLLEPLSCLAIALFLLFFLPVYFAFSKKVKLRAPAALGWIVLVTVSGILLAAIQILPTLELIQSSGRRGGLDFQTVSGWSLHPINLLQLIFPRVFGDFFRLTRNGSWAAVFFENREPYLLSCYLGAFSLLLALFGLLLSERRWMSRTLALVALLALLLASGKYGPVYEQLFSVCPLFRYGRYPVKYLLTFNFSLALLAGYGMHRILALREAGQWGRYLKRPWVVGCLVFLGVALAVSVAAEQRIGTHGSGNPDAGFPVSYQGKTLEVPRPTVAAGLQSLQLQLGALAVFLALSWAEKVRTSIVAASVIVLLLFDFGIHDYWINPLVHSELYEAAPAAVYLQERERMSAPFRIYKLANERLEEDPLTLGETNSIVWNYFYRKLTLAQFLSAKDHISFAVFLPVDRLETIPSQQIYLELASGKTQQEKLRFLAGLNVGYVLATHNIESPLLALDSTFPVNSPEPLRVYRLSNTVPRVFLTDSQGQADRQLSFQEQLSVEGGTGNQSNATQERAQVVSYRPNQVDIETESPRNRLLVLLDSYYPGWKATIDGTAVPVVAANFVYRAIELPQGRHRVDFRYESRPFTRGAWISGSTGLAWLVVCVVLRFRRSMHAASSHAHV